MRHRYFIVTTLNQDLFWKITGGPFRSRRDAAEFSSAAADMNTHDIYVQTEARNAQVVAYSALRNLTVGIPRRPIGEGGVAQMFERYEREVF